MTHTMISQIDSYWMREAALAYDERKKHHVWDTFEREGWKPWMRFQVAPKDLPWFRG